MKDYLGYDVGTYPVAGTPISSTFDMIGHKTPEIYPVSAINIQTNLCRTDISIPNRRRPGDVLEDGLLPVSLSDRDHILDVFRSHGT